MTHTSNPFFFRTNNFFDQKLLFKCSSGTITILFFGTALSCVFITAGHYKAVCGVTVCVKCLIGKQKKPILFKVTEQSRWGEGDRGGTGHMLEVRRAARESSPDFVSQSCPILCTYLCVEPKHVSPEYSMQSQKA